MLPWRKCECLFPLFSSLFSLRCLFPVFPSYHIIASSHSRSPARTRVLPKVNSITRSVHNTQFNHSHPSVAFDHPPHLL
ncbi:hypothetical protein CPB83DRAFT_860490 [Crepidotus variabilis]|uniref:Uncharacterized protein n=1 Tax=Crepidotus variabilis TaxID=179855 RepID=A0A9P6E8Z6_9AGAR|nr:hypothetical protein CPB83DRAFT_860490 [Crepidotus variabilis]